MKGFSEVTKLLPLLPKKAGALGKWIIPEGQLPFVSFGEAVYPLRDALADLPGLHPEMNLYEYQSILAEKGLDMCALQSVDVSSMEARTVAAMLVAVWRGEKFSDGLLLSYLENGCVQRWLERLQEIDGR